MNKTQVPTYKHFVHYNYNTYKITKANETQRSALMYFLKNLPPFKCLKRKDLKICSALKCPHTVI